MANYKSPVEGNNILFLRGTQAELDKIKKQESGAAAITEGAFYLTEDTHRLYAGGKNSSGTKSIDLLSQSIAVVDTVAKLGTTEAPAEDGQFVYITNSNILAVYDASESNGSGGTGKWLQINVQEDRYARSVTVAAAAAVDSNNAAVDNAVDLKTTINVQSTNAGGTATYDQDLTSKVQIKGQGDIKVGVNGNVIEIDNNQYSTGVEADHKISLKREKGTGYETVSSVTLAAGNDITLTDDTTNNKITVASTDAVTRLEKATAGYGTGNVGFKASIEASKYDANNYTATRQAAVTAGNLNDDGGSVDFTFDPKITLGDHTKTEEEIHFTSGIANLPVYTKSEINALKMEMDSMTYIGTAVSQSDTAITGNTNSTKYIGMKDASGSTNLVTTYHVGDTFRVGNNFGSYKANDILIANGTEYTADQVGTTVNGVSVTAAMVGTIDPTTLYFDRIESSVADENTDTYVGQGSAITDSSSNVTGAKFDLTKVTGITSTNKTDEITGTIKINAGNKITIGSVTATESSSQVGGKAGYKDILSLDINHATYDTITPEADTTTNVTQSDGGSEAFTAVTSITRDNYGHVTAIKTGKFTPKDTTLESVSLETTGKNDTANTTATITNKITVTDTKSRTTDLADSESFAVKSDTLYVSTADVTSGSKTVPTITMNLI